jgi:ribosomal protein L37AE/L43A
MSTNDKLREEFEAWDRAEFDYSPSDYARRGENVYEDAVIQQCWMAYRAASSRQEERVKRLREALEQARDHIACTVCHHDETQQRGVIWTECLQCGVLFADRVPEPEEPAVLAAIRAALKETE